jgi:hypothetical protein
MAPVFNALKKEQEWTTIKLVHSCLEVLLSLSA